MLSQEARIIHELKKAGQRGLPNYRFPQMGILRYSARIGDLRKEGYQIVAERQYLHGRWSGVWIYRLLSETPNRPAMQFEPLPSEPKTKRRKVLGIF